MVYIKRLELSNFKSFGGTTSIPLLPGFTVVSGPNGSGKSNILDALLFCLGLSSSKGMRAERLPDLINHNKSERKTTKEASVTVTFDLEIEQEPSEFPIVEQNASQFSNNANTEDSQLKTEQLESNTQNSTLTTDPLPKEWSVTRRLRVTPSGYTSTYYINGISATLTQLHEELNRLRIYPEGYNVVLQGDVTGIISMNARQRREIIDELAGVAQFDRQIELAKDKLEAVKERIESSRIIERELISQRDRLAADRAKAEQYQQLRQTLAEKQQWEITLKWQFLQQQLWQLREQIEAGDRDVANLKEEILTLSSQIARLSAELDAKNRQVKALGEDDLLSLKSTLAGQQAEKQQLENRQQELETTKQNILASTEKTQQDIQAAQIAIADLQQQRTQQTESIACRQQELENAGTQLDRYREQATAIAAASQTLVQQQTDLNRQIEQLLQTIDPLRAEKAQLQERDNQLARALQEQTQKFQVIEPEIPQKQERARELENQINTTSQHIQTLSQIVASSESQLQIQQQTQKRLLNEQRDKQRELDKLEAQIQVQQESLGTYASKLILQTGIPGVCGLVAQLGHVEPRYQLALETAAGGRLGHLVVEDDGVAAASIELLKQKRAGRATFLPLNKIKPGRFSQVENLRWANGFIDYAINLIECEQRYDDIFAYVFGNTAVFATLEAARAHLGKCRIVTLEGELLEASGAMTGGSSSGRSPLHFGRTDTAESTQQTALKERLAEIERVLLRCEAEINHLEAAAKQQSAELITAREGLRENQLHLQVLHKEIETLVEQQKLLSNSLASNQQELNATQVRLQGIHTELPGLEARLNQYRASLAELENNEATSEWQQIQARIREQEANVSQRESTLRSAEQQLQDWDSQGDLQRQKIHQWEQYLETLSTQRSTLETQNLQLNADRSTLETKIGETIAQLGVIEEKLAGEKQQRDHLETELRELQNRQQQQQWQLEKLQQTQLTRHQELETLQTQRQAVQAELPDPLPEVPENQKIEPLQKELRSLQKRLQALEPVNMLAIEEYEITSTRLQELTDKLTILENERTELLLRIENFTTLRHTAFKQAFNAVNQNFQVIFAELSDGDGYLQLEDPEDPFNGGLNLVAHPKGKPVQRLASMSGGEKSLTALSFIFALQRYRPSPFYAFDEVDMFLDGANVERLAKMIQKQAQQAQFIVVSLRRPMIESSQRTIGVTQARGAYTQVLGIKIPPRNAK